MNPRVQAASWMPARGWWARLAAVLATGLASNWLLAGGVTIGLLLRPFDFLTSFLLANGYTAFIHYEGGHLERHFAVLAVACVFMLVCYGVTLRERSFDIPWSPLTRLVLLYFAISFGQFVRGMAQGHPWRMTVTEFLGPLGLMTTILIANYFEPRRDLRIAILGLLMTAFGSAALGFYIFHVLHVRAGGFYFIPVPGIAGLFLLNLALRSPRQTTSLACILVALPLFLHQFLSFRRGVWLGLLVALIVSVPLYAGWGRGTGVRWRKTGTLFGIFMGLAVFGAFTMALLYGQMDILEQAGGRFASIGGTENKTENYANIDRFAETMNVVGHIRDSPWIGHGLGFTYLNTSPLTREVSRQWSADGNYQLIWLKTGLLGLVVFFWMLWTAIRMSLREARRREDPWEASWFATSAGATILFTVFAGFDWPFAQVYTTFLLGMFWGGAVAMTPKTTLRFRWSAPARTPT